MDSNHHLLFAEHPLEIVMLQRPAQDPQSIAQLMDFNHHLMFAEHQLDLVIHLNHALAHLLLALPISMDHSKLLVLDYNFLKEHSPTMM
jgi:2-succinyl-5-enolpyruvyl-6-hydroxy-3-cyclohexene-1-carboxylate synthase